jgi:hypothetical protein
MSYKDITKVVLYILVQLSSLNNTMSMVSGVSVQVTDDRNQMTENSLPFFICHLLSVLCPLHLPDT